MVDEKFELSPRIELILANIKTVREIRRAFKEEGEAEIKRFLRFMIDNIRNKVAGIRSWELTMEGGKSVAIYPGNQWKVRKDDYVAISLDFSNWGKLIDPGEDPWVGLRVPEDWSFKKGFKRKLNEALGRDFMSEWDEPEDEWPVWAPVRYEDHVKGDTFDIEGFLGEFNERISTLVSEKSIISRTIKQIQRGPK